jgi:Mrp family chromosome partitioning ATPase
LATSLAGAGKSVLLIDGDLRRPSVMQTFGLNQGEQKSKSVNVGAGFDYTIYTVPSTELEVLVPELNCAADPFELLTSSILTDNIYQLGRDYDHIIIDTPPVLAFPDSTLLARMAGSALVVTFCGRTWGPDLAESVIRLEKAGILVVGTVMNNVPLNHSYNKYGYGYYRGYADFKQGALPSGQSMASAASSGDI